MNPRVEIDAARIIAALLRFESSLIWTRQIIQAVTELPERRVDWALRWMGRRGYISTHQGEYIVTSEGRAFYDACQRRPEVLGDFREWKNEVLTGMDSKGAPSAIDNAVLPGVRSAPVCDVTPEDIIARQQMNVRLKQRTARDLGLTADEFEKYMIEGRIQICNGPKKSMPPHPGVFNRDREGWKAVCRRCQAAERRRNRK